MINSDLKPPEYWMNLALEQAKLAGINNEIPVGAVIVKDNKLIATGYNSSIKNHDSSAHAEIIAMRAASNLLANYRLTNCDLYVTLEPCMMCLGNIIHARINKLYYGASDPKTGSLGGLIDLTQHYKTNHNIQIFKNILAEQCSLILKDFFKIRR